jgi:hypothetical protein
MELLRKEKMKTIRNQPNTPISSETRKRINVRIKTIKLLLERKQPKLLNLVK